MIKTQLIGRLGRDAELKTTKGGERFMELSLAVDLSYRGKDGNKVEKTQWVKATQWNVKENATIQNYLKKGGEVYVEGEPTATAYTNKDGAVVGSLELKITGIKLIGGGNKTTEQQPQQPVATPDNLPQTNETEDLPF